MRENKKDIEIIKEILDNTLSRAYPSIELNGKLNSIIQNYNEGDIHRQEDQKIFDIFNLIEENLSASSETEEAAWEIGYIKGYQRALLEQKIKEDRSE